MNSYSSSVAPADALKAMYEVQGKHPGCRAGHPKGRFCGGVFTPSGEAVELTDAAHLQHDPVEVTARLSKVASNPSGHDGADGQCGMATRFHLPDGSSTDLIGLSLSRFTNANPADFVEMTRRCFKLVDRRTRFRLAGTARYCILHLGSVLPMLEAKRKQPVPSYANCRFNSINAFLWTRGKDPTCFVRYSWLPEEGELTLGKAAAKALPSDYLLQDLEERLGPPSPTPIRFRLEVQLASREDEAKHRIENPMKRWPASPPRAVPALQVGARHRFLVAGVLELTHLVPGIGETQGFNPLNLTAGIEPSDDPVLRFRQPAYERAATERPLRATQVQ